MEVVWRSGSSHGCDLTDDGYGRRSHLRALRGDGGHHAVGRESLFRDHVSGAEEELYHSEDIAAKKQEGMHLDLQQMQQQ